MILAFEIRCVPPSVTAQQKRQTYRGGKLRFFHGDKMMTTTNTWASLLAPHVPALPVLGAVELSIVFTYPHLKGTAKRDLHLTIPKVSKPDAGNAAKHLEDLLSKMRFFEDDVKVARLVVDKFHGPEADVGIRITIRPMQSFVYVRPASRAAE